MNEERLGQRVYNAVHDFDPKLAEALTGTIVDCFYRDDQIPAFVIACLTAMAMQHHAQRLPEVFDLNGVPTT